MVQSEVCSRPASSHWAAQTGRAHDRTRPKLRQRQKLVMGEEKFSSDAPPSFLIRGRQNGDHPVFLRNDYDPGPLVDRISSFFQRWHSFSEYCGKIS
jgi:hypothetical protein